MTGPLAGIRVADFSNHAVGPTAASLLGALGADVIKIEPPKGDPIRKILPYKRGLPTTSTFVNLNKRSIVLNLKDAAEHAIAADIVANADVLIENFRSGVMERLGLGHDVVSARNPGIVYCSSGSFGPRGPMAAIGSTDSQGQAFGGYASINGDPDGPGQISRNMGYIDVVGSQYLVQGALTGLYARQLTGRGQYVLGSQLNWVIGIQTSRLGHAIATGESPRPMGTAVPHIAPSQAFRARDARWIFLSAVTPEQWTGLCTVLGHSRWLEDPRFATNADRVEHRSELAEAIRSAIATKEGSWWLQRLTAAGVPCAESLEYEDYLHNDHFIQNRSLIEVPLTDDSTLRVPSPPWDFSESTVRMEPAPLPGQHAEEILVALESAGTPWPDHGRDPQAPTSAVPSLSGGPLAGLTVVDVSQGISGPYATLCMGDYGATVIKVEPPEGDYARTLGAPFVDGDSAMFTMLNRNKKSIALDLDEAVDRDALIGMLATADVFVEDLSVQRREALGLTFDELHALNPRLVHCSVSQLGQYGPWRDKAVTELELQALTGATHFLGQPGEAPVRIGADICSVGAGQNAYQGVLASLLARFRTGRGEHVHVSQLQATLYTYGIMLAAFDDPDEWAGHHCSARGNETDYGYATADEPLQFGPAFQSDQPWIDLCHELDMEDLLEHPYFINHQQRASNAALGKPILEERFRKYSREHLLTVINETGNIAVPLNDHVSVIEHEQVLANDRIVELTLQTGEKLRAPGIPWELSETPGAVTLPPPLLDEHRAQILAGAGNGGS